MLQNAQPGEVYDIERVKEGEFQNWVSAKKSDGSATVTATNAPVAASKGSDYTPTKSSYPTDEERAKTQVYIVRQSNITAAINTLSVGAKKLDENDVLKLAKVYEAHVFGDSVEPAAPINVATAFDDLDDLPQ